MYSIVTLPKHSLSVDGLQTPLQSSTYYTLSIWARSAPMSIVSNLFFRSIARLNFFTHPPKSLLSLIGGSYWKAITLIGYQSDCIPVQSVYTTYGTNFSLISLSAPPPSILYLSITCLPYSLGSRLPCESIPLALRYSPLFHPFFCGIY